MILSKLRGSKLRSRVYSRRSRLFVQTTGEPPSGLVPPILKKNTALAKSGRQLVGLSPTSTQQQIHRITKKAGLCILQLLACPNSPTSTAKRLAISRPKQEPRLKCKSMRKEFQVCSGSKKNYLVQHQLFFPVRDSLILRIRSQRYWWAVLSKRGMPARLGSGGTRRSSWLKNLTMVQDMLRTKVRELLPGRAKNLLIQIIC